MKKILDYYERGQRRLLSKKTVRVMKLTFFLSILTIAQLWAAESYAQLTKLTLRLENVKISEALREIEDRSEFFFLYSPKLIDVERKVTIDAKKETIRDILTDVFANQVKFAVYDRQIILTPKDQTAVLTALQQQTVTGKVTDKSGALLPGVAVLVKGTTNGVTTDMDGNFSLTLPPEGEILVFSFVGMNTQEVTIGSQTIFNIVLEEVSIDLEEIVVIGYGTAKKSDLTGAISSVSQNDLKDRSNNNVMQSVAAKVAGVQILQTDGTVGFAPTVKIRGTSTITSGTTPLYVIDGIPFEGVNLNMLNPSDIESLEILKDASSSAIYGSRGSNGVVIITTKSGKAGKTNVEFNFEQGYSKVYRTIDMMNAPQYIEWYMDARNNSWIAQGGNASDPNSVRPANVRIPPEFLTDPEMFGEGTDWQDVVFRLGKTQNITAAVSGGNEKTNFKISAAYLSQKGVVDENNLERITLNANIKHQINNNFSVGTNTILSKRIENPTVGYGATPESGKNGAVANSLQNAPIWPVYNENGNLGPWDPNSEWGRFLPYGLLLVHPYVHTRVMEKKAESFDAISTLWGEVKFLKNFAFKTAFSSTIDYYSYNAYIPEKAGYGWDQVPPASANTAKSYRYNWLMENTLSYKTMIDKHNIDAFLGYTAQKDNYESGSLFGTGFPNDQVHTLNAATTATSFSESASEWSLLSYIGRVNYTYDGKYLMTATLRRDGSSRFGANTKWGYFPSFSAAWRISEENFMDGISWIDNLKLRLSYGVTGNNLISDYGSIGLLGQGQYAWGNSVQSALFVNSIANPDLKWEKTGQWNIGLNIGLFSSRVYLEMDYYNSLTRDMLLNVPVPVLTGFTSQLTNIGQVRNKGFELLVSTNNLIGSFKWNTDFNFSLNRNKVVKLGPDGSPMFYNVWFGSSTKTEIGQPISNYYGYIFDGVFKNQAEIDAYPHHSTTTPGDPKVRDVNGDKIINSDDRTIIGNVQPDFIAGMTNSFQYMYLDFSFTLQAQYGNEIANINTRFSKFYNGGRNQFAEVSNYWKSESDPGNGEYFKPMVTYPGLQSQFSTYYIEDGSFLRIRNVQLGYIIPQRLLSWGPLTSVRIYANIENLHVFSKYLGFDPENSYLSGLGAGQDYAATPMPTTITFGLKVNL